MKRTGFILLSTAIFACSAAAQTQAQPGSQPRGQASAGTQAATSPSAQNPQINASLANGSPILVELTSSVDSKKAKPNDTVMARTAEELRAGGKTIIPKGTKVVGHVTEASSRAKGGSDSSLGIVFDKAIFKGGEEVPMDVAIVAVAPSPSVPAANPSADTAPMSAPGAPSNMGRPGSSGAMGGSPSTPAASVGPESSGTVAPNGSASQNGLDASGRLMPNSRGVIGLKEVSLQPATSNPSQGSVISSSGKNVHLDSDTQLLLVTQGRVVAQAPKS
jgi:hypothetical protein